MAFRRAAGTERHGGRSLQRFPFGVLFTGRSLLRARLGYPTTNAFTASLNAPGCSRLDRWPAPRRSSPASRRRSASPCSRSSPAASARRPGPTRMSVGTRIVQQRRPRVGPVAQHPQRRDDARRLLRRGEAFHLLDDVRPHRQRLRADHLRQHLLDDGATRVGLEAKSISLSRLAFAVSSSGSAWVSARIRLRSRPAYLRAKAKAT